MTDTAARPTTQSDADPPERFVTVLFYQHFYLQNYQNLPPAADGSRRTRGGVVLMPQRRHRLEIRLDGSQLALATDPPPVQIYFARERPGIEGRRVIWGDETVPPTHDCLPTTNELFGRPMRMRTNKLLQDPMIPRELNARVVLSGGTFSEIAAFRPEAREILWTMHFSHKEWARHRLTDRLVFRMKLEADAQYWLVVAAFNGTAWKRIHDKELEQSATVTISNLDPDQHARHQQAIPSGTYFLGEYVDIFGLTELRAPEAVVPVGEYPSRQTRPEPTCPAHVDGEGTDVLPLSVTDPVCGGGQGDPDPPDDPNEPPDPPAAEP
jgi:hypothetical protein